jgi:UrcA family protein
MNLLLLLSSLGALLGGEPSSSQSQAMVVHLRDLNLRSEAGSAVAVQRIRDAAKAFCAERPGPQEIDLTVLDCRRDMAERAVARLGSAEVRALYLDSPSGMVFATR